MGKLSHHLIVPEEEEGDLAQVTFPSDDEASEDELDELDPDAMDDFDGNKRIYLFSRIHSHAPLLR